MLENSLRDSPCGSGGLEGWILAGLVCRTCLANSDVVRQGRVGWKNLLCLGLSLIQLLTLLLILQLIVHIVPFPSSLKVECLASDINGAQL